MASNAYQNFDESLTNSSSNEDLSPVLLNVGTRQQVPRSHVPIEAKVSVTNGRQDESANERDLGFGSESLRHQVVEDPSMYLLHSVDSKEKTSSFQSNSMDFDSTEDLGNYKKQTLFWLRHPKVKENWKTVTAAFLLFISGIGFMITGIVLASIPDHDGPKSFIFFICAAICIIPGGYHIIYIYRATKGQRGYNFESIPSFR